MKYVVARIATRNPAINGQKLYLSRDGFWTRDLDKALRFDSEEAAAKGADRRLKAKPEPVAS